MCLMVLPLNPNILLDINVDSLHTLLLLQQANVAQYQIHHLDFLVLVFQVIVCILHALYSGLKQFLKLVCTDRLLCYKEMVRPKAMEF